MTELTSRPAGVGQTSNATTLDPLGDPRWRRFVQECDTASVFHHPEWLGLLHRQYRYPLRAECITDSAGNILAGLPVARVSSLITGRREIAVPFSDLCPILVGHDAPAGTADELADVLRRQHERHGHDVEVRGPVAGWPTTNAFYHHVIPLDDGPDVIRSRLRANARRDVARAEREGVTVRLATDEAALRSFYRLHLHTRRRLGVPTQPWSFIRQFTDLFAAGLGFVALAVHDGSPIAGAVYLHHGRTLTYKYGASLTDQRTLRPNHAIFMEAVRWGSAHGMSRLDLGRTDLANEGLRAFKRGWAAEEHELAYARLSRRMASDGSRHGAPSLSASIITRMPPVVGRVAGAVLYRHFA